MTVENPVAVKGVAASEATLKFGDDGGSQHGVLPAAGAFEGVTGERIFKTRDRGLLAVIGHCRTILFFIRFYTILSVIQLAIFARKAILYSCGFMSLCVAGAIRKPWIHDLSSYGMIEVTI